MTAVVGILCKDGVVVGTDSSATFTHGQFRTIEQPCEKLLMVKDLAIIAGTGFIGHGQRFHSIVSRAWDTKSQDGDRFAEQEPLQICKILSREAIRDLQETFQNTGKYGAILAFVRKGKPCLCEFEAQYFQPELKTDNLWYCSMGSTQPITDPFLGFIRGVFWQDGMPDLNEGKFVATWTLKHAIDVNTGGVKGPINLAILENQGKGQYRARLLEKEEIDQQQQMVAEAENHLKDFRTQFGAEAAQAPEPPKP